MQTKMEKQMTPLQFVIRFGGDSYLKSFSISLFGEITSIVKTSEMAHAMPFSTKEDANEIVALMHRGRAVLRDIPQENKGGS